MIYNKKQILSNEHDNAFLEPIADIAHPFLSGVHISAYASVLQIYPYVQPVCHRGFALTWAFQGHVSGYTQDIALPSLGWTWL